MHVLAIEEGETMTEQLKEFDLAFDELSDAWGDLGYGKPFAAVVESIEARLTDKYPNDQTAIREMIGPWLVVLGASNQDSLLKIFEGF